MPKARKLDNTSTRVALGTRRAPDPNAPPPLSDASRHAVWLEAGSLMLLAAVEAGASKAAELDGELLACCAEANEADRRSDALAATLNPACPLDPRWEEVEQLSARSYDLRELVARLPARTPEGMQAKAKLVVDRLEAEGLMSVIALSLASDVLGRASA